MTSFLFQSTLALNEPRSWSTVFIVSISSAGEGRHWQKWDCDFNVVFFSRFRARPLLWLMPKECSKRENNQTRSHHKSYQYLVQHKTSPRESFNYLQENTPFLYLWVKSSIHRFQIIDRLSR